MKDRNKAIIIIFVLGIFLMTSVFIVTLLPVNTHEALRVQASPTLPQGVHIPININTASKETLCLLDDIGPVLADNIITYREEHGGFKTKEEVINVHGLGEKTFNKIKNYISIDS